MSDHPLPSSRRLTFRQMGYADLDLLVGLLGDRRVMRFYPHPFDTAQVRDWITWNLEGYARDGFGLWLLHDQDGTFVGECGLTWQSPEGVRDLELGYHLLPEHQGLGLASEAAAACLDLARKRGIERLIAIIRPENRPSQRVATGVGLRRARSYTAGIGELYDIFATEVSADRS